MGGEAFFIIIIIILCYVLSELSILAGWSLTGAFSQKVGAGVEVVMGTIPPPESPGWKQCFAVNKQLTSTFPYSRSLFSLYF